VKALRAYRFIALLWLAGVASGTFYLPLTWASFHFNADYIASNLCVNRDKPAAQCHGKCYLTQQLKKSEQQPEQKTPASAPAEMALNWLTMINCGWRFQVAFSNQAYPPYHFATCDWWPERDHPPPESLV